VPTSPHSEQLPFPTRLWFAWVCLIRVLFDGSFAARVFAERALPALPGGTLNANADQGATPRARTAAAAPSQARHDEAVPAASPQALQLLALLQREGRLIDFLEQDVTAFSDAEVGAAARVVHEGCRKILHRVTSVEPVRAEHEGDNVVLGKDFAASEVVLVGNVQGAPPYRGTLRHRGWRAAGLSLPEMVGGHDPNVLAPAEVEL
jgi:hypothetical protein